jgi:hypothetical protein
LNAGCALDVGFMITNSGAVEDQGAGNYENYLLPFARDVTSRLNPRPSGTHVGVVGFGKYNVLCLDLLVLLRFVYHVCSVYF